MTSQDRQIDGGVLLDEVEVFMRRFIAFPSESARVATVLWAGHAHLMDVFDSTPRLGFLSPEPGSGKTRALEILDLLVPNPMHAVNATPAALFRAVADMAGRPTILFDEIDTVFGPKAKENEELRGLLNAGHRRSGVSYRCVGDGSNQKVVAFPSYAAVAMGGLGSLPDTILTRSVIIRMRRRAPGEVVEPFRQRMHEPEGHALRKRLAEWAERIGPDLAGVYPVMPDGVNDRPADVWEPLLTVADAAGQGWPDRARTACVELLATVTPDTVSLGIRLLLDIRDVFEDREAMFTAQLLTGLHSLPDAPWADLKGKALNEYSLGRFLRDYEIKSKNVRIGPEQHKGYERTTFHDAWSRYCPAPGRSVPTVPSVPTLVTGPDAGTDSRSGTDRTVPSGEVGTDRYAPTGGPQGTAGTVQSVPQSRSVPSGEPVTRTGTLGTLGTDSRQADKRPCSVCHDLMDRIYFAAGHHPWCEPDQIPAPWPALPYARTVNDPT